MSTIGYIDVVQHRSTSAQLKPVHFDLLICMASWEQRCREVTNWIGLTSERVVVLCFDGSNYQDNDKQANLLALKAFGDKISDDCQILDLPQSLSMIDAFGSIEETLHSIAGKLGRPLRICVDISSMPRSLITFVALASFVRKHCFEVTIYFAVSAHRIVVDQINIETKDAKAPFAEGKWKTIAIPYGEGRLATSRDNAIFVSLGLDTFQIFDFVEEVDPSVAYFFIPQRGDNSAIDSAAMKRFELFEERFENAFKIGKFHKQVVSSLDINWFSEFGKVGELKDGLARGNLMCPFGPKVHAVGMALVALKDESVSLVGRIPNSYLHYPVDPTGEVYLAVLTDLSSIRF
jgi:hypothetical protein